MKGIFKRFSAGTIGKAGEKAREQREQKKARPASATSSRARAGLLPGWHERAPDGAQAVSGLERDGGI